MGPAPLPGPFCYSQSNTSLCVVCDQDQFADVDQSFLEAGDDFCKLEYKKEDLSDLEIRLDRSKILTSGRKGEFLWEWKEHNADRLHQPLRTSSRNSTYTSRLPTSKPAPSSSPTCRVSAWSTGEPRCGMLCSRTSSRGRCLCKPTHTSTRPQAKSLSSSTSLLSRASSRVGRRGRFDWVEAAMYTAQSWFTGPRFD